MVWLSKGAVCSFFCLRQTLLLSPHSNTKNIYNNFFAASIATTTTSRTQIMTSPNDNVEESSSKISSLPSTMRAVQGTCNDNMS